MSTMRIKYDQTLLKLMYFFESATHSKLKDCFVDSNGVLTFVVESNIAGAIGKSGVNAKKVESALKRRIRIVAFSPVLEEFIVNLLRPFKVRNISVQDGTVIITPEPESRGYIIGRAASNLRNYEGVVKRYFDVKEIKVV